MDTRNDFLVEKVMQNTKIIDSIVKYCLFDKGNIDDDRGALLFKSKNVASQS
jgi:hypothetical protein